MPSEHDLPAAVFDDRTSPRDLDFIGPLCVAGQAWADQVLRSDSLAARYEPVDVVIRRRESHIGELYRVAALMALSGDLAGGGAAGLRAVAESRALTEFLTTSPAYCLDCFLQGERCEAHAARRPVTGARRISGGATGSGTGGATGSGPGRDGGRAHRPEWRRFGADEFPSAGG
ncbi:MAG TPA: hypothetical protein VMB79_03210 [Jatrophihabitans sp.]|nr:hypothetical protein [Jatrophihabitans sp.]